MFKDIQVTVYDIFGYFFPGAILLFALTILFWAVFWPQAPYVVYMDFSGTTIAILVLIAYLAGHLSQACGNFLERLPAAKDVLDTNLLIDEELVSALKKHLTQRFGHGVEDLSPRGTHRLCDQSLVHHGSFGEREIFMYREGL